MHNTCTLLVALYYDKYVNKRLYKHSTHFVLLIKRTIIRKNNVNSYRNNTCTFHVALYYGNTDEINTIINSTFRMCNMPTVEKSSKVCIQTFDK